jgi:hypothetical protein
MVMITVIVSLWLLLNRKSQRSAAPVLTKPAVAAFIILALAMTTLYAPSMAVGQLHLLRLASR